MQGRNYKTILYFIASVIFITLAIQVYWNYKNYQAGKQQLINDVQTSLDNAVSLYYENKAAQNTLGFLSKNTGVDNLFDPIYLESIIKGARENNNSSKTSIIIQDSLLSGEYITIQGSTQKKLDSIIDGNVLKNRYPLDSHKHKNTFTFKDLDDQSSDTIYTTWSNSARFKVSPILGAFPIKDSLRSKALADLTTQIIVSFQGDMVDVFCY